MLRPTIRIGPCDRQHQIDDVETSRPAPGVIGTALEKGKQAPEQVLALDDSPYDVEAAGKCGVGSPCGALGKGR